MDKLFAAGTPKPGKFNSLMSQENSLFFPDARDAATVIGEMRRRGIHVSIGHTDADPSQIHDAAAAGAELSTHLGNGVAAMLPRHPNLIWAQLADERLTVTLIADGHHLDPDTLLTILRSKGLDRSILISDAVALAGMPAGRHVTSVGGEVELSPDGRASLVGTAYLAGAVRSVPECLSWLMEVSCLTLAQALDLVTTNPARFAGRCSILQPGSPVDFVCLRHPTGEHLVITELWLDGERRR
jgi:N-acetylglucosamine-6-phosphate deacetylase